MKLYTLCYIFLPIPSDEQTEKFLIVDDEWNFIHRLQRGPTACVSRLNRFIIDTERGKSSN